MKHKVKCEGCPCLNMDGMIDESCGLKYPVQYDLVAGEWEHFSLGCGLKEIRYETETNGKFDMRSMTPEPLK